jgi:phosphate starvation-inducible PhoH-like protein
MNIHGLFLFYIFFITMTPINTLFYKKQAMQLFMKKTKHTFSYLYTPKTVNQETYFNYLNNDTNKIIISTGPAGTGKTLFACQKAITQMKAQEIEKIIITRPVVTVEEEIGFLPGSLIKKMDPWTKPIFDIFLEFYSKSELDLMLYNGKIEICPLAFMRGRTFKNSFIIADEMQNSSPNQMKMLVTRLGENSRMVITGDLKQTDIIKENGLYDFVSRMEGYHTDLIKLVKLENDDIERSEIVKTVIAIYEYKKTSKFIVDLKPHMNTTVTKLYGTSEESTKSDIKNFGEDDAALIPKRHISRNFDIFFDSRDF